MPEDSGLVFPRLGCGAAAILNNARLLAWKLYVYDLSDFERVFSSLGRDPKKLIEFAKSLEKEKDPEAALKSQLR